MDGRLLAALERARDHWRTLERDGAPEGWPAGSRHYLLVPVAEDDCAIARLYWSDAERAAMHPEASAFDPLWVSQFRRARGLRGTRSEEDLVRELDALQARLEERRRLRRARG